VMEPPLISTASARAPFERALVKPVSCIERSPHEEPEQGTVCLSDGDVALVRVFAQGGRTMIRRPHCVSAGLTIRQS
jgi:hypothetical protein